MGLDDEPGRLPFARHAVFDENSSAPSETAAKIGTERWPSNGGVFQDPFHPLYPLLVSAGGQGRLGLFFARHQLKSERQILGPTGTWQADGHQFLHVNDVDWRLAGLAREGAQDAVLQFGPQILRIFSDSRRSPAEHSSMADSGQLTCIKEKQTNNYSKKKENS